MTHDPPRLREPRRSILDLVDLLDECWGSGEEDTIASPAHATASRPGRLQCPHAALGRLFEEPGRRELETLMRWSAQAAGRDRISTLLVCRRYPPVLATLAMLTLSAEIEGARVVRGDMSDEEFQKVAAHARQLTQAPWVALDASQAGSTERLFGSSFAEVVRRRQIRLVIVDHRPSEEELRRLRWWARRLRFTALLAG